MTARVLDESFTVVELLAALRLLRRRSASGPDGISGQALLNPPDTAILILLKRFNDIWATGYIPHHEGCNRSHRSHIGMGGTDS